MPILTIFSGPNGSGKSSIIEHSQFAGRENLLQADAIAARISFVDPRTGAVAAGREVLLRAKAYLAAGQDFAIETTLSGSWTSKLIDGAIAQKFFVRLVFVCLDEAEQNIQRVKGRVAHGGHHVPDEDVRRRYARSLSNLTALVKIVNEALIFDNAGPQPRPIIDIKGGKIVSQATELPHWACNLLECI